MAGVKRARNAVVWKVAASRVHPAQTHTGPQQHHGMTCPDPLGLSTFGDKGMARLVLLPAWGCFRQDLTLTLKRSYMLIQMLISLSGHTVLTATWECT